MHPHWRSLILGFIAGFVITALFAVSTHQEWDSRMGSRQVASKRAISLKKSP
jgi:hypothetical protein